MPPCKRAWATTMPPSMRCRGRIKCSAMPLATSPVLACSNTHNNSTARIVEHAAAILTNNKVKANKYNQSAAVMAPTMVAVEADSTKATVVVADTIKAAA